MVWSIINVVAAAIVAFFCAWWLWWRLPKRQVDRLRLTIRDPKARADIEDNIRKTIGQLLGGTVVLLGAGLAYLQFSQQQQASRDLLISNQVAKGFEQLGSSNVMIRLGGIYLLAGVMNTSEQYHQPVLETLSAFVRDRTQTDTGDVPPAADIQAALTIIGRRTATGTGSPDLTDAHIPKVKLSGANLHDANLSGAYLINADLSGADLHDANLSNANLSNSNLSNFLVNATTVSSFFGNALNAPPGSKIVIMTLSRAGDLSNATLLNANLSGALLSYSNLTKANLQNANLSGANLKGANLTDAHLDDANLSNAWLDGADLSGAQLNGVDLSSVIISQAYLNRACGVNVNLKPGLTLKPCPEATHITVP